MSFQERFKERTSFISKEGFIGLIAQNSNPIDKTPKNAQMSLQRTALKDITNSLIHSSKRLEVAQGINSEYYSSNEANISSTKLLSQPRLQNKIVEPRTTPRILSKGLSFQENGNFALKNSLCSPSSRVEILKDAVTPISKQKDADGVRNLQTTNARNKDEVVVFTNIQLPQRKKIQRHSSSSDLHETPKSTASNEAQNLSQAVQEFQSPNNPVKLSSQQPIRNLYGKLALRQAVGNFKNPYINNYKQYEYYPSNCEEEGSLFLSNQCQCAKGNLSQRDSINSSKILSPSTHAVSNIRFGHFLLFFK